MLVSNFDLNVLCTDGLSTIVTNLLLFYLLDTAYNAKNVMFMNIIKYLH